MGYDTLKNFFKNLVSVGWIEINRTTEQIHNNLVCLIKCMSGQVTFCQQVHCGGSFWMKLIMTFSYDMEIASLNDHFHLIVQYINILCNA
jgi:hypothetical protein